MEPIHQDVLAMASAPEFLWGGGTMGRLMREHNWSSTPLGSVSQWPQSLRAAVSICLGTNFPIAIYWGRELALLYNDAWSPIPGEKHPWALGRPGRDVWPEIWNEIGPLYEKVQTTGEGVWQEDQLLPMRRYGYTEECYFNFTFSPIRGEHGRVEGIFNAVVETTFRVIGERRERTLRELAERLSLARSEAEVFNVAVEMFAAKSADVPFALLYRLDEAGEHAERVGLAGLPADGPASPSRMDVAGAAWPLSVACANHTEIVNDLSTRFPSPLPGGPWPEATERALVLPIAAPMGDRLVSGILIAGVSPRRALDDDYRAFVERAAAHMATALVNVRAYEQERKRAEALAEIDRVKTAFFSNVSHEFRTPLTLMLGPLEEALAARDVSAPVRAQLELAQRNAGRLLRLVNSLLDFSRIEAGRVNARYQATDLAAFSADIASSFRSAVEKAGLELRLDCSPLAQVVYVDREMWEKILLNLLSNAFKFTFDGAIEVTVRGSADGRGAEIRVRDSGIGIPADELPKLFERFHRVEGAQGRSYEGSGIGLALVQDLVKLHGGTIAVTSDPGRGTTFQIDIPFGSAHLPSDLLDVSSDGASAAVMRAREFADEAMRWLPEPVRLPLPDDVLAEASSGEAGRAIRRGKSIVVADDNADMRSYLQRLLESEGYSVRTAADGEAALLAVRQARPDLVLSDIMMPKLDGFGLLRGLRGDRALTDLPVLLLSARAGSEAQVEGLEAGADDYLAKPFAARELLARVNANIHMAQIRRELSAAVRESEARFRSMADNAPVMMWVADETSSIIYLNRLWQQFTGTGETDSLGHGWLEAVHGDDKDATQAVFTGLQSAQGPSRVEYRLRRHDGCYRWVLNVTVPRFSEDGRLLGFIGSVLDIDERKEAELALKAQAEVLQNLNSAAAAVAGDLDLERVVQTVTDAGVALAGAEFGAFFYNVLSEAGESYLLYTLSGVPRSAFEKFPMPRNTAVFGPTFDGTAVVRSDDITKDPRYGHSAPHHGMPKGHLPVCSYLAVPVRSRTNDVIGGLFFGHSKPAMFSKLAEEGVVGLAAQAAVAMDNARLFQERARAREQLESLNAQLEQRVLQEVAQRTKAEDALRQAQKMEAVGQLTGGIAHDFNNLLTIIVGGLDTIRRAKPEDHVRIKRSADMALQGAQRAANLTGRLLAFSRRQPLAPKPLDLNGLVRDMTELLHRTLGEQIELEGVLAPRLWTIEADANQLESAIINLAVNARDAMPDGGKLTIETANTFLDDRYVETQAEVVPGQYVVIAVSDTGLGIAKDVMDRVFEPFYTTKEVGRGTGLGLSMVYGFVKQSGGHVTLYSEVGEGTTVKLYFPRHHGSGPIEETSEPEAPSASAGEVILVVEDNDDVRAYSVMILTEMGYQVLEADAADGAIVMLEGAQRIDLLFTDVVLPGRSGKVLANEARRIRPGLKVLFTTGYSRNAIVHHGRVDPGVELLSKPFTFEQLAARVRDLLDQR
ncbi:MAG: response regulator [Bradyrhizobium sp.]|uniref:ATP-binding protein n=1 Tax=Bradyrhizobium sp. TaxID=376 RepID=UPI001DC1E499|nr:ATP-binding protein [Bradyrhizobium sp.]MBV9564202.1 response regulator [Bradyrhizobium sp.]